MAERRREGIINIVNISQSMSKSFELLTQIDKTEKNKAKGYEVSGKGRDGEKGGNLF